MNNYIIENYTKNWKSIRQLSKELELSPEKIKQILDENNVPQRLESGKFVILSKEELDKLIDMNNHFYSYTEIARELGYDWSTIKKIFYRNNIEKTPNNKVNHNINFNYFSKIDTEEKAYWLGFLFTDGSIRNNEIRFQLKAEDKYMIEKFKQCLNSDAKIQEDTRPGKHCFGIEIVCPQIVKDLEKYGIVPNKTYSLNDIHINLIPKDLQEHYIRGLIDGDGSIYEENTPYLSKQPVVSFTAYSEKCVESFRDFIDKEVFHTEEHNKINKNQAYVIKWKGGKKIPILLHYLYDNATIYLKRKKNIADNYLDNVDGTII